MSVFSATQLEWDLFVTKLEFSDPLVVEASSLVFVEAEKIKEASNKTGAALNDVFWKVREIEQFIGQTFERLSKAS